MKKHTRHFAVAAGIFLALVALPYALIHAQDNTQAPDTTAAAEETPAPETPAGNEAATAETPAADAPEIAAPATETDAPEARAAGAEKVVEGISFRWCPPGTFTQGFTTPEAAYRERFRTARMEWFSDAVPAHEVTLEAGFWISRTEITREQWRTVVGTDPWRDGPQPTDLTLPVAGVNWDDCQTFTKKLQQKAATRFRLPTESEWEYACRAGSTTLYFFGDDHKPLDLHAWHWSNTTNQKKPWPQPAGAVKPNAWGLCDMLGNVWEWCMDGYSEYERDSGTSRVHEHAGGMRVIRGASYMEWAPLQLPCYRSAAVEDARNPAIGFRVVMEDPVAPAGDQPAGGG